MPWVGELVAIDPDADFSTFTLLDDAGGRFKIVGNTLVIADRSLIDYEAAQFHDVKVRATDPHGASIEQSFRIYVVDLIEPEEQDENHAPVGLEYSGPSVVEEGAANGTFIGGVLGFDFDQFHSGRDSLTYTLIDDADGRFALVNGSIVVKDGSRLDYESAASHDIAVRVTDTHGAFLEKTFTIFLKKQPGTPPENQAPTEVYLSGNLILENATEGTLVGTLGAHDPDPNESFTYTLVDDAGGRFAIRDGQLVVLDGTLLDYEAASSHVVRIRVTDAQGLSHERSFRIQLKDAPEGDPPPPENRAPIFLGLWNDVVAENAANGTEIGFLVGCDVDAGDALTYSLTNDAGGRFAIEGERLLVKDGSLLNYEAATTHDITVRVTDRHGAFLEKMFTILLKDLWEGPHPMPENHAPSDIDLTTNSIWENAPNGSDVGYLLTSDPDLDDDFTYELLDDADGRFEILGNIVLAVKDGTRLDYEAASSHQVKVRVTDSKGATFEKTLTIKLMNIIEPGEKPPGNRAPTYLDLLSNVVEENAKEGTEIGSFFAFDSDDGDALTYSLLNDADGRFAIKEGKLVVADGSLLNYEAKPFHDIKVRVTDSHGESYDKTFTILLKDVIDGEEPPPPPNRAPTDIIVGRTVLDENPANGFLVSALRAVDPDPLERFTYTLVDDADGRFAIEGYRLVVADGSRIDYEAASSHAIRIRVTDSHGASFEKDVTIRVKDVAEASVIRIGSAGSDKLAGGGGNDKLTGGAGNDVLAGGTGKDILTGSRGKDAFVFDAAGKANMDRVTDFSVKDDTIHLAKSVFGEMGGAGKLSAKAFWIGSKAHDANDRIIYNSKTGVVSYDADGSGQGSAVQIAALKKGLSLTHKDFLII